MDVKTQIAVSKIKREFATELSERDVASSVRLSRSRFGRRFKRETGQTFKAFVLAIRMTKAREMLLSDATLSIKEVAAAVGYKDRHMPAFNRDFKKYWGYPPSRCPRWVAQAA